MSDRDRVLVTAPGVDPGEWSWPDDLPRTPRAAVERAAHLWGDDHVLYDFPDEQRTLTVAGLVQAAEQWAGVLRDRGVRGGDRVAVCLRGHSVWPVLQVACSVVGATYAGVNLKYRRWEVERFLDVITPALLVAGVDDAEDTCVGTVAELAAGRGTTVLAVGTRPGSDAPTGEELAASATPVPLGEAVATGDDVALVQFTSGSTGAPKAVAHTHEQVMLTARSISALPGYDETDVVYSALPFYHVGGSMCTGPVALVSGARFVVPPRFSASGSVREIIAKGCTATQGHAAMFTMQVDRVRAEGLRDRLRLRKGWAAAPPAVIRQAHDVLGMTDIVPAYGMSECGMTIGGRADDPLDKRINTLGRPTAGARVRLAGLVDGAGELQLSGAAVVSGYLDDQAATETAFTADGFLHTGDLVRLDDEGYLVFVDRLKDMIKPGGENVSTTEVETFLMSVPHVVGASVVGAPDHVLGEVPVAFVQTDSTIDPGEILAACRAGIATFKVPRWIEIVPDFPVMATGKIDKSALRDRARRRTTGPERRSEKEHV